MAWAASGTGTVAAANAKASSASFTTGAVSADAGETVFLYVEFDNQALDGPSLDSISKPGGETGTWTRLSFHTSGGQLGGAACRGELWGITLSQAWSAFQPVVSFSSAITAKASHGRVFTGGTLTARGTLPIAGAFSTSGAASKTLTGSEQPQSGDLVIAGAGQESATAPTADADTTNGSWNAGITSASSGSTSATNVALRLQWKIVTATGDQTFNPGLSGDSGVAAVALVPAAGGLTAVGKDQATAYDIAAAVGASRATAFEIAAPVGASRATAVDIFTSVGASQATAFDLSATAGSQQATEFYTDALYTKRHTFDAGSLGNPVTTTDGGDDLSSIGGTPTIVEGLRGLRAAEADPGDSVSMALTHESRVISGQVYIRFETLPASGVVPFLLVYDGAFAINVTFSVNNVGTLGVFNSASGLAAFSNNLFTTGRVYRVQFQIAKNVVTPTAGAIAAQVYDDYGNLLYNLAPLGITQTSNPAYIGISTGSPNGATTMQVTVDEPAVHNGATAIDPVFPAPVYSEQATAWDLATTVGASQDTGWGVEGLAGASQATEFGIGGFAGSEQATEFDVLTSVAKEQATAFDLTGTAGASQQTAWDMNAVVGDSEATAFDLAAAVGASRATAFDLTHVVGDSEATAWDIAAAVGKSQDTGWGVEGLAGASQQTAFDLAATVGSEQPTEFGLGGHVGKDQETLFDLGGFVGAEQATEFDIAVVLPDWPATNPTREIAGVVRDHETGAVAPGATVRLFRTFDDRLVQTTVSAGDGSYAFPRDELDPYTYYVMVTYELGGVDYQGVSARECVPA